MKRLAALTLLLLAAADTPDIVIPAEFGLIEGVAWNGRYRQLFASGVEDGALLVREGEGWRRVILPFATAGLFGIAVDNRRALLWMTSGVAGPTRAKDGFRGLIAVRTLGFTPAAHAPVPASDAKAQPGDLAVAPDGSVFVSDGATGAVYVCRPDCTQLAPFLPEGTFGSAQGLAVSRDGKTLFVADYGRGLFRVDARKPKGAALVAPVKGVDGLVRDGDALIAIINGDGRRIVRLTLDAAGTSVVSQEDIPIEPAGEPTLGTIVNGELLYVADAQWDRFDESGKAIADPRPTMIRAIALPPGPRPPEMRVRVRDALDRPSRRIFR